MMDSRVFNRTLLGAYNLIDNYCDCLDKEVYSKGIGCSGLGGAIYEHTQRTADCILGLISRKINLINLKVK
ncbi:MAG: hypothetical protein FWD32_01545, partial [Firmicutes bacterium]|nr:hypothetical protein [Bacillota bacterium]